MPFRKSPTSSDGSTPGLKDELSSLLRTSAAYLQARTELAAIEGREAGGILAKRLVRLLLAAFFLCIFYLLLLGSVVALLGHLLSSNYQGVLAGWIGAAMITAVFHFIIGLIFWNKFRREQGRQLFQFTRAEWQKDQQWINQSQNGEK
ncbi:MAG: phage holin family protein [Verrucomicrobiaceae bacterium]